MKRTIVLGIIGAGRIGRLHAENIRQFSNAKVKTISDLYIENAKEWGEEIGVSSLVKDYNEVINDEEIDAVFVCSPTNTHGDIIANAAKKGKHIFCEKPVSFSIKETENVLQVVKENNVNLQVGFNRRFDRNFLKIHESVKSGVVGQPHVVKITSRDPAPPPEEYIKNSGGIFFDMTIHDFDMARYLSRSEIVEVFVTGANLVEPYIEKSGDIDTVIVALKFENGAIGVIDNSRKAVYGYDQRVEVFGEKGNITCENDKPTTVEISTVSGVQTDPLKYFFLERYQKAYINEAQSFIKSLQNDEAVECDGIDGLQAQLIAKAAQISYEESRPVKLKEV